MSCLVRMSLALIGFLPSVTASSVIARWRSPPWRRSARCPVCRDCAGGSTKHCDRAPIPVILGYLVWFFVSRPRLRGAW
jgi:hypothetical protein